MSDSVIENGKGGAAPLPVSYNISEVSDWVALLKPRVMSLVVFSAVAGLLVAPGYLHPVLAVIAILCIAVAAGASGAINMWYDRDIDAVMNRTKGRAIPMGKIAADDALGFAIFVTLLSVMIMGLVTNWMAAGILAFASFFYNNTDFQPMALIDSLMLPSLFLHNLNKMLWLKYY